MRSVVLILMALVLNACGSDPSSSNGNCANDDVVGTWKIAASPGVYGSETVVYSASCTAVSTVSGGCTTTFSFSSGINETVPQSTTALQVTAISGPGCLSVGTIVACDYQMYPISSGPWTGTMGLYMRCGSASVWDTYVKQ
jgi:hypothetical protein